MFGLAAVFVKDGAAVRQAGFFQGYSTVVIVVIVLQVSGGVAVVVSVCMCVCATAKCVYLHLSHGTCVFIIFKEF